MRVCSFCSNQNPDDKKFCSSCGKPLASPPPPPPPPPKPAPPPLASPPPPPPAPASPVTVRCSSCGTSVPEAIKFCHKCGQPMASPGADDGWQRVGPPTQQPAPPPTRAPEPVIAPQVPPSTSQSFSPVVSPDSAADDGWQQVGSPNPRPAPTLPKTPEPAKTPQATPASSQSFSLVATPGPVPVSAPAKRMSLAAKSVAAVIVLAAVGFAVYLSYALWTKLHTPTTASQAAAPPPTAGEASQPATAPSAPVQPVQTPSASAPNQQAAPLSNPSSRASSPPQVQEPPSPPPQPKNPSHGEVSVVGDWRGHWENSLGQHGDASWEVSSEYGGDIRGLWDALQFQGRRDGNIVTFHIDGGQRSCNDYEVRVEISSQGNAANIRYDARNHCAGNRYNGTEELQLRSRSGAAAVPPAATSPTQTISVGGQVQSAMLIRSAPPQYPPTAKAAGITGVVLLRVTIGTDGSVQDVQVISGNPLLAKAAVDAVRGWVYRPTLVNGRPTQVETEARFNFTLDGR